MAFPTVSIGQKIKASWGNLIADRFNNAHQTILFTPAGALDATTGGAFVTWVTLGNVTVPSWAVSAIVILDAMAAQEVTATGNVYQLRVKIGTDAGVTFTLKAATSAVNLRELTFAMLDRITLTATGSKSVTLEALRVSGTGNWRFGTGAPGGPRIHAHVHFLDN